MSTLYTFPGQGAQTVGMLHDLPDEAVVARTLEQASEVLGLDVLSLDSAPALRSTVAAQLCLLVAGVAMARLLGSMGATAHAVAGLSVGAYPAAVTAEVLRFEDAVTLVECRARLMQAAYPDGHGMTAVVGLERAALERLIARVHGAGSPVYLANVNAPNQLVIAGDRAAMDAVGALARAHGAHDVRALAVGVPSHCRLLDAAAADLAVAMNSVPVNAPRLRYYSASLGRELRQPQQIAHDLVHNMARPVHWHETSVLAAERGAALMIEMPPGAVLTALAAAALPEVLAVPAAHTRLDTLIELVTRENRRLR